MSLAAYPRFEAIGRSLSVVALLIALVGLPTVAPILVAPSTMGNDPYHYYAAGERLNAGSELYALAPGDRPVENPPPYHTTPLVSHPTVAVLWRPLALLPIEPATTIWWLGGAIASIGALAWMWLRGGLLVQLMLSVLSVQLAWNTLSGNVNAFVVPMLVLAWTQLERRPSLAGVLVAGTIALRLSPILLIPWLAVAAPRRSLVACMVTCAVLGLVSLIGAGADAHRDWLDQARYFATVGAADDTLAGRLGALGASEPILLASSALLAAGVGVSTLWFRLDPQSRLGRCCRGNVPHPACLARRPAGSSDAHGPAASAKRAATFGTPPPMMRRSASVACAANAVSVGAPAAGGPHRSDRRSPRLGPNPSKEAGVVLALVGVR